MKVFLALFTLSILLLQGCIQPPKNKKDKCNESLLGSLSSGSQALQISDPCAEPHQYQCDLRIFSPDVETGEEIKQFCLGEEGDQSQCLMARVYTFSTEDQRFTDPHAKDEDFQIGGQYNYQEVTCYQKHKHAQGLYQVIGDGATLEKALGQAQKNCRELRQKGQL